MEELDNFLVFVIYTGYHKELMDKAFIFHLLFYTMTVHVNSHTKIFSCNKCLAG